MSTIDISSQTTIFKSDEENKIISSDNYEYSLSLRRSDIHDPKDFKKFIRACEAGVRRSPEYLDFLSYIKETLGIYKCQVTGEIHNQSDCHLHHHPYSMYDIVESVITEHIECNREFCSFDICTKIIELHYEMKVPFIFLLASIHDKYHNGFINLPIELCHGETKWFYENYKEYMSEDTKDRLKDKFSVNAQNCGWIVGEYPWYETT